MRLFLLFVLAIGALCLLDRTYYDALGSFCSTQSCQ